MNSIWQFLVQNSTWVGDITLWLGMMGIICIFAEANNQKALKFKRRVGGIVVTIWIWGVMISGLYMPQYPPVIQQHIDPPHYWWKGAPKS